MSKRIRCRAIIFNSGKIVSMYRENKGRIYYTFPGGGIEENESEIDCVKREVLEEFGLIVEPVKQVYSYENEISVENFYVAKYISGEFGSGTGEEYKENRDRGVYIPKLIDIKEIPNLPLMPPEIASVFYEDYLKNGEEVRNDVLTIQSELHK